MRGLYLRGGLGVGECAAFGPGQAQCGGDGGAHLYGAHRHHCGEHGLYGRGPAVFPGWGYLPECGDLCGVAAGTHVVTVKNAWGCISEAGSVL